MNHIPACRGSHVGLARELTFPKPPTPSSKAAPRKLQGVLLDVSWLGLPGCFPGEAMLSHAQGKNCSCFCCWELLWLATARQAGGAADVQEMAVSKALAIFLKASHTLFLSDEVGSHSSHGSRSNFHGTSVCPDVTV